MQEISPLDPWPRHNVEVLDSHISFIDVGSGTPIVFLHGNPTSSYLWRNVIPHVCDRGRALAPDLIGMGQSGDTPDRDHRFQDHARYLDAWFDAVLPEEPVILVLHDWGSALGFHWACRNPHRVAAIAYMEALVQSRSWSDFPAPREALFRRLRSDEGTALVREQNFFVEGVLPKSVLRKLGDAEMNAYRRPFSDLERRMATLVFAQELPIDGEPADVVQIVDAYGLWLARSGIPKLFINAEPGALLTGRARDFCRSWPNQREVTVAGIHYLQEDSPREIGEALSAFIGSLGEQETAPSKSARRA